MYMPGLLEPGRYQDELYMLPKDFSSMGVYYNKKIFDEYGVDYPTDDWTWDEFLSIAQELTKDTDGDGVTDLYGVQLTATWTTGFEYFIFANGGRLISEDGTQYVGYLDSEESIGAVQFFSDLYNVYKVAPPAADFNMWAGGNSEFDNGQAAMRLFGRWPQESYLSNPNIELGTVQPPAGAEQANILFWGGFGISSTTKNADAAWRFLKFYAGQQGSEVWVQRGIPPVASVAQEAGLYADEIEGTWIEGLDHLVDRTYVFTPYWGATGDAALRKALETILIDPDTDVAELMRTVAAEAQTALDEKLAEE
jgi:multiple sugar transport system substrate-binding protein